MKKRRIWWILTAVLLAAVIGCGLYANDYYPAGEAAAAALAGNETVVVQKTKNTVVFVPESPSAGVIFYPGGKVEHTAYAPLMLALAEQNVLCVLVEMPLRLAVLDMDAAEGIPEQYPQIENWYIGGHSLGGNMAASFVSEQAESYEGLVLLASYSTADLTGTGLEVVSLYGSKDGVLNRESYEANRGNLPEGMLEMVIDGGNHALFGNYGAQEGDGEAAISGEEQLRITAEVLTAFFAN